MMERGDAELALFKGLGVLGECRGEEAAEEEPAVLIDPGGFGREGEGREDGREGEVRWG